jgi:hypothetical protein
MQCRRKGKYPRRFGLRTWIQGVFTFGLMNRGRVRRRLRRVVLLCVACAAVCAVITGVTVRVALQPAHPQHSGLRHGDDGQSLSPSPTLAKQVTRVPLPFDVSGIDPCVPISTSISVSVGARGA